MSSEQQAIVAGGCFWNLQDRIRDQHGVLSSRVGYTGGAIADLDKSGRFSHEVVTEVNPAGPFRVAEQEHQDYLQK
ncbi:peptide-methionine (S)-S-oxide reductase [Candidatus Mycobacterium wuenschmannii]|uniref:peptide-methionine (S)-S-oxide reductase n=1 Tax=Candidatus Mycobacterium wuenschmannii TaxID=3027808 RepID=A0ABY8VU46_9MYCO|nr:peptide-methionine (S)-S-oxide reductase [Candidatus Mycobacterium wuenschmannii]WIM87150.1 peptide-methionine (S)-S-oxide reductase [Candidatus Mycobacterium wuenschmannii]